MIQDEVLREIESQNSIFYLTGGTALSRVYLHHRYSDDLDLFSNFHPKFDREVEMIRRHLEKVFASRFKVQINQDQFKRFFITFGNHHTLKIEFINDVPYRVGSLINSTLFSNTDSWENILTNKISALSRNEEKDLADLLFMAYQFSFNWKTMILHAKEKDAWVDEVKVAQYFADIETLSAIKWLPRITEAVYSINDFRIMARDVLQGADNSLVR